jgi:hypothetical protein
MNRTFEIVNIPLNKLVASPLNVRKTGGQTIDDLAASIQAKIEAFYRAIGQPEWIESSNELAFLNDWLKEVRAAVPLTPLEMMERDLRRAIGARPSS